MLISCGEINVRIGDSISEHAFEATDDTLQSKEVILVSRCLQGDHSAWESLVRAYGSQIARQVGRFTNLRGEVEDLTQEVLLRVYIHLASFRPDSGNLSHWVRRVCRNLIIDHLRRNRHIVKLNGDEPPDSFTRLSEQSPTPEVQFARDEVSYLLRRHVGRLAPELRQVLVLRYLEEMSYLEISRRLGVPNGTVKSRLHRGRTRLAHVLCEQRLS